LALVVIVRMTDSRAKDMVLVYDLRRDGRCREQILCRMDEQWQAYLRGERPASVAAGRITELFCAPSGGERMFRLNEGGSQSSWVRHGGESWYAVGRRAQVEWVVFHAPHPIGDLPVVTRIWIGDDDD
jgi:hypothetical protein